MASKNLITLREACGLPQVEIAKKLSVSKQTVYKWERGLAPVALQHWKKYAAILNATPALFEDALIETLKSYAIESLSMDVLDNAAISGHYDPEKLFAARSVVRSAILRGSIPPTAAPSADDLDGITRDLAKKIHQRAVERANSRKGYFREQFAAILKREYRDFTDEQCLALIAEIASDTPGTGMVRAELSRMTHSIAFLADENKQPRPEVMP